MNIKSTLLPLIIAFEVLCHSIEAQSNVCGMDLVNSQMSVENPEYTSNLDILNEEISELLKETRMTRMDSQFITIPVVVHVIHLGEPIGSGTNISNIQIQQTLDGLNARFSNLIGSGVDMKINFKLASRDPLGCYTTGINRVNGRFIPDYLEYGIGPGGVFCQDNEKEVKDFSRWPVLEYYNIWVVSEVCDGWYNGYSHFPDGTPYDGTVVVASEMTYESPALTHEVGHGFFLYHTFEGDSTGCPANNDCMVDGDKICDTPPHRQAECGDTTACTPDGLWANSRDNYMSYCKPGIEVGRFTADQKNRVMATFMVYPRNYLLQSSALDAPDSNCARDPFITQWNTSFPGISGDNQICIPGIGQDYSIIWQSVSDPSIHASISGNGTTYVTFPEAGIYRVYIFPSVGSKRFSGIAFGNGGDRRKLILIEQWGDVSWENMENAFYGCENMTMTVIDTPNLFNVTSTKNMFRGCKKFNGEIEYWNVSHVQDMEGMFSDAIEFNQPLNQWNTSAVKNMESVFQGALSFNQNIGQWNTENVTTMENMFYQARAFNKEIGSWNTGKVRSLRAMFYEADAFNQDIGDWNTSSVTDMFTMFYKAISFNQNIGSWNTGKVLFTRGMFSNATSFNQDISTWNTTAVVTMEQMFQNAFAFNQSLGNWKLNPSVHLEYMLNQSGVDCAHYSSTLIGWQANNPNVTGRSLHANTLKYGTNAEEARNTLIQQQGWTINGDQPSGMACDPCAVNVSFETINTTCGDENGSIHAIASGGNQYVYAWSQGDTLSKVNNLPAGLYSVTVTADNGCTATATTFIEDSKPMTLDFNFMYPYLSVIVEGGKEPLQYVWNSGDTLSTIEPTMDAFYKVVITDADGCQIMDSIFISVTSTIHAGPSILNFYPNPSKGNMRMESIWQGQSDVILEIYNILGQKVFDENIKPGKDEKWISLNAPGLYIYNIRRYSQLVYSGKLLVLSQY